MSKKICLIGFIFIIAFIAIKGTLTNFINPMLIICLYISLPILLLFLISDFRNKKQNKKANIIFILPIILAIIGNSGTFSEAYTQNLVKQSFSNTSVSNSSTDSSLGKKEELENQEKELNDNSQIKDEKENEDNTIKENGEVINVNDDNYINILNTVYENIESYLGTTINIEGCVFRSEDTMLKDEFGAGKYYMYCCAMDMSLCGFLFQYDDYKSVENKKWYKIEAVVGKHEVEDPYYGRYIEPLLKVKKITEISKPKNTMVYQNY